jgi:hypothetical protein
MNELLDQIEASLGSKHYFLSLYTSLTIPDIAGALGSDNGEATGQKYAAWFDQWVRPQLTETVRQSLPIELRADSPPIENPLTGDACYRFRCSLLHEGSAMPHPKSPYNRILFIEPGATSNILHYGRADDALIINLDLFCREMITAARQWLIQTVGSQNYLKNYERFARRHANGVPPYVVGLPVIG